MFTDNLKVILLSRKGFHFYYNDQVSKLEFTGRELKDLDFVDPDKLKSLIFDLIDKSNITGSTLVMVLSSDFLFTKEIIAKEQESKQVEIQKFIDEIPFDRSSLAIQAVNYEGKTTVFATNINLYNTLIEILHQKNLDTKYVVPITLFDIAPLTNTLTKDDIKNILTSSEKLKQSNFLSSRQVSQSDDKNKSMPENSEQKEKNLTKQIIMTSIGVGLILTSITLTLYSFGLISNPFGKNKKDNIITSSQDTIDPQTPQSTPQLQTLPSKDEITIQVLNGTGIEGQASSVKSILEGLGYQQIETGNTTITGDSKTSISYSQAVPSSYITELEEKLAESFIEVITQKQQVNPDFDILITTGLKK